MIKESINKIKDELLSEIERNVYDMNSCEKQYITLAYDLHHEYSELKYSICEDNRFVYDIMQIVNRNLQKVLYYLLIPDNEALHWCFRILTENYIILGFLLKHKDCVKNWYAWVENIILNNKPEIVNELKSNSSNPSSYEFSNFYKEWKADFLKLYIEINKSDKGFDKLLREPYGWAFPVLTSKRNLFEIAKVSALEGRLKGKIILDISTHSNCFLQSISLRTSEKTVISCVEASNIIREYVFLLYDIIDNDCKNQAKMVIKLCDKIGHKFFG